MSHFFVPPYIMESLARKGIAHAGLSLKQATFSRKKRKAKLPDIHALTGNKSKADSLRYLYDCQNQSQERLKLIRSDAGQMGAMDDAGKQAWEYVGLVREYLKNILHRDSIDDAGMDYHINIHYGVNYANAFWDGDEIIFGDGDGEVFGSLTRSLDVIAHEIGHGITQFTANLEYNGQSGALNESFSDVLGTAITQYIEKTEDTRSDWLIGDEIMINNAKGEALRSMLAPGTAFENALMGRDPQPAHMKDYFAGPEDSQGVHINSGIPNKAFALSAREIGIREVTLIWYEALKLLWPTANFNDAATVISETARKLVNSGKASKGSPQKIRAAFRDVGII
jgi:Zn-dependent metalloprotease